MTKVSPVLYTVATANTVRGLIPVLLKSLKETQANVRKYQREEPFVDISDDAYLRFVEDSKGG